MNLGKQKLSVGLLRTLHTVNNAVSISNLDHQVFEFLGTKGGGSDVGLCIADVCCYIT